MDLRTLLDVPVDSIKKPPVWPAGLYYGHIAKYEPGESREKKTPFLRIFVNVSRADESIPKEMLEVDGVPIDLTKRQLRKDYYLTEDAKFRLVEMIKAVGIETEGKSLGQVIPALVNRPVMIDVTHRGSQDGTELYTEISDLKAPPEG